MDTVESGQPVFYQKYMYVCYCVMHVCYCIFNSLGSFTPAPENSTLFVNRLSVTFRFDDWMNFLKLCGIFLVTSKLFSQKKFNIKNKNKNYTPQFSVIFGSILNFTEEDNQLIRVPVW